VDSRLQVRVRPRALGEIAEEAANFYVSVFSKRPGAETSRVRNITHYGEAGPRPAGMVMTVDFDLEGHGITP
jgi:predicted 3-demethylubiquinone-9 3-methyltransferase (glyoxalase superfamily)